MNLYAIRRPHDWAECRNSNGTHGVLALGEHDAGVRENARRAAASGETLLHDGWLGHLLAADGALPGQRFALWLGEVYEDARRPV